MTTLLINIFISKSLYLDLINLIIIAIGNINSFETPKMLVKLEK